MPLSNMLMQKAVNAVKDNPEIAALASELTQHEGHSTEDLALIGFKETELKKLDHAGMLMRGYRNEGRGNQVRWIFIKEAVDIAQEAINEAVQSG